MPSDFRCNVVTPEGEVLDEAVRYVDLPLTDGRMGFAPGRAPIVAELGVGRLRASGPEGDRLLVVDGGFVQMDGRSLTVLTERATAKADVDRDAAQRMLDDAQALPQATPTEVERRSRAVEHAQAVLRLVG